MKRSELTVKILEDRCFYPTNPNDLRLKDIVFNIQENEHWRYLRCTTSPEVYTDIEHGMCSTYKIYLHKEYLEVSDDGVKWYAVAFRYVEFNRSCIYAD